MIATVHTLRCQEGWKQFLPWKYVCLEDRAEVGKKWADIFPQKVSSYVSLVLTASHAEHPITIIAMRCQHIA
jgi:hypothetical protein